MPHAANLVRTYPSQAAFDQDAERLAKLGYIVLRVSEQEAPRSWIERLLQRLAPIRLVVTYRDQGIVL